MSDTPRVSIERSIFRQEVFEYQRSRSLGRPVDERSISGLWCVATLAALALVYGLFATATYAPRLAGHGWANGDGAVRVSVSERTELLRPIEAGSEVTLLDDTGAPGQRMRITGKTTKQCASGSECVELEGVVDGASPGLTAEGEGGVQLHVVLPARSILD